MVTYIDALPKELRIELQRFRNYMFLMDVNKFLKEFTMVNLTRHREDAVWFMSKYKENIMPANIELEIVYATDHSSAYIQLLKNHVLSVKLVLEIYNNLLKFHQDYAYKIVETIFNLNIILTNNGYTEQIVYYPNGSKIFLLNNIT